MAHALASIGLTDYATSITAGHHLLTADEGGELGGKDAGPAPYDLLCSALGACTAITLRMYAKRKGWSLTAVQVDVHYSRHEQDEKIDRTLRFAGELDDEKRARLADIAERTPVTLTLKRSFPIETKVSSTSA